MALIEKRGNRWRVRVRLRGVSKSATFDRKAEASAWAAQLEAEILKGEHFSVPDDLVFSDLLFRYLNEVTPTKRGSLYEAARLKTMMKSDLGKIPLDRLAPAHFADWRDARLAVVKGATVARELGILSAVCQRAVREWGLLPSNPVYSISKPRGFKPRNYVPSDETVDKVVRELGVVEGVEITKVSQRVGIAVLFAIETAMRAGEICNMVYDDLHLEQRFVHLPITKNGNSRDVPLSKRAIELLGLLPHFESGSVFGLKDVSLSAMFSRAKVAAGCREFRFHDTRHKALTRMAEKVQPMQLAKISGHKDLKILLNVYYNPTAESLADLLD